MSTTLKHLFTAVRTLPSYLVEERKEQKAIYKNGIHRYIEEYTKNSQNYYEEQSKSLCN